MVEYKNKSEDFYFLLFALSHLLIWTILPSLIFCNLHLDTIEAITWGNEWQMGYEKHPPFSAWVAEIFVILFQKKIWAMYFLSQICIVSTLTAAWFLAKKLLPKNQALLSVFLLESVFYYNFTSIEYNTNILLMPLWSWIIFMVFKIYEDQKNLLNWLIFAVLCGCAFLTKYYSFLLIISIFCFFIYDQKSRKIFKSFYPYFAGIIFFLIIAKHLFWMIDNDFSTLHYIERRGKSQYHFYNHILFPIKFIFSQILALLPAFLILFFASENKIKKNFIENFFKKKTFEKNFFIFLGFLPFILTIVPSIFNGSRVRSMWGAVLWFWFTIFLFYFFKPEINQRFQKIFYKFFIIIFLLTPISYFISNLISPHKYGNFDGKDLSQKVEKIWQSHYNNPLEIIVGNKWLGGNVNFFLENRPRVFLDMDEKASFWLSLADLESKGGIIIWNQDFDGKNLPERFKNKFSNKIEIEKNSIKTRLVGLKNKDNFNVGVAIISPKNL
jgi:4-amino-4-deoxy-L-arabinose transferase-like glycosyltransferase